MDAAGLAPGGVYALRDEAKAVVRTGRTSDLAARQAAHFNDPVLGDFQFNVEYRTDVYAEQRGLEQVLYDRYPGAQLENGGFNKIRGISPSNPNPGYVHAVSLELPRASGAVMAKLNYRQGDWFAVPLRDGGYATGLVARANPKAALLGYFFGPRREGVPTLEDVASLRPSESVLVGRFGHLGLTQGTWPILGCLPNWDKAEWPMPVFVRFEELSGRTFNVVYDDDDPAKLIREEKASGPAATGPKDGLMGAGYVERSLTALLSGTGVSPM